MPSSTKAGTKPLRFSPTRFFVSLHQRAPDGEPPAVLWLIIGCKGNHSFRKNQIYSHLFVLSLLVVHQADYGIFCGTCQKSAY